MQNWCLTDPDRELFQRELHSFVPDEVFDAHVHWYQKTDFVPGTAPDMVDQGPDVAGLAAFTSAMQELLPGRQVDCVAFPLPHAHLDVASANQFLVDQLSGQTRGPGQPRSLGQMLVTPQDDPGFIREFVRTHRLAGLKCYHLYATSQPTFQASVADFLPEAQVQVADELGLTITLHIVKSTALADPANQEWIRETCRRYPRMQLILAHAARGFNPHHTIAGIHSIAGLENVWFDTSVVTDAGALEAIIRVFGHSHVLYGSDYPVSQIRGRCVALGDSFFWISPENTQLQVPYADLQLSLIGLEALRTLKVAALSLGLSDRQVEDIFAGNARRLWSAAWT